jgi:electron transport complex protein RnfB
MLYTLSFPLLAAAIGYLLGVAALRWRVEGNPLVEEIAAMLPNGQCGQCGFPGCGEAAKALAAGELPPNCCPPGGNLLATQLSEKLGVPLSGALQLPQVAAINTSECDGCGRCFKVCPFDAIVGATKQLHGVIPDACTGCGQCLSACPHQGISLRVDPAVAAPLIKPSQTLTQSRGSAHV